MTGGPAGGDAAGGGAAGGGAGGGGARTASAVGLRLIGHHDLAGRGDGMQVIRHGNALYVGRTGTTRADRVRHLLRLAALMAGARA